MENNLYKKLRFFALCLAIICMVLSLIKRAKAESMPDNEYNYIINKIDNADNYNSVSPYLLNYVKPYFPYFVEYIDNNYIFYKFVPTVNSCIGTNANSFSVDGQNWYSAMLNMNTFSFIGSTDRRIFYNLKSNLAANNLPIEPTHSGKRILAIYLCYDIMNNSLCMGCYCEDNGYIVGNNNQTVNVRSYENTNNILESNVYVGYVSNSTSTYWFSWVNTSANSTIFKPFRSSNTWISYHTFNSMISNYDGYCMFASSIPLSGCLKFYRNIDDLLQPDNNTDGFKVFKSTRSGRDYLIFDGLNAVPINIRNGNWYLTDLTSTLGFTVTTETTSYNFNYTFDINDAYDDFPYNSEYFKWQDDWGNLYLRWEIPIDELNLPDDSYGYTENVIMTVSNNVSVNNYTVPYLGQFIYLTPVYLYGTQAESGLINPENSPSPVIPENPVLQEDKVKNYNSLVYGTLLNKSTSEYQSWLNELHDGVIYNQIVFTQLNAPTLQDLFLQFPDMISILNDVISYAYGIQGKNNFLDAMETYIEENAFSQYVDYLVFVYNGNDADHSDKFDFYIFETAKGRQKALSFLLDTSNTYFDKQFDVLRNSIPYIKDSIDRLDTNLFNLGEDIFSQNNSIIANLISIDNKFNDLQDLLKDLFNKLFDRLNYLHLSQLDAIDNKLSTIVSAIQTETPFNEDDTIAESIAYYQSHTQAQAVLEDKYSVWFTGYCHFWLQEYGEEEQINNTRSKSRNVTDFASSEKRHILFRTFKVITDIYNKMQEDLLFNRVEELFDYMLDTNSDVSHTRRSYFYDVFNEQNTPTLDYNPYE